MRKTTLLLLLSIPAFLQTTAQEVDSAKTMRSARIDPYKIKGWLDVPVTAAGTAWTLYGFNVIYNRDSVPASEILALDRNKIETFDRSATANYDRNAFNVSNYLFYGSMPLPLIMMFDRNMRRDGVKLMFMYVEAQAITGTVYTIAAMNANRFRPYVYNPNVPIEKRTRGGVRNSFFAGHVALVGTSTFFMAKTWSDYHPGMKGKWILYAVAGGLTATTGIMRVKAGEHFPSDVLVGSILGPAVGILVPYFHKKKISQKIVVMPRFSTEGNGFAMLYKF